jgi:uroporphyrinogen-III decarboxylase
MFSGDDISASTGPLISKQVWHEFYKDNFKRMVDAIHSYGALAEFHNCGNNQYLIEEFLGIGVDICQLPMPNEALLHDKERFGNRLAMTGGWDRIGVGAKPGATEEQVRQSARDAIDRYGKEGALIFWDGGIIMSSADARQRMEWLYDEVDKYGREVYR